MIEALYYFLLSVFYVMSDQIWASGISTCFFKIETSIPKSMLACQGNLKISTTQAHIQRTPTCFG